MTKAEMSRAADALLQIALKRGIKPHIYFDPQGCPHLVEADALTVLSGPSPDNDDLGELARRHGYGQA